MTMKMLDDMARSEVRWTGAVAKGATGAACRFAGAGIGGYAETEQLIADWRGFRSLQFTVWNPWDHPVVAGIEIYDRTALDSPYLAYGDYIDRKRSLLIGEGVTHVVIAIDPIRTNRGDRMLDLSAVVKLALRFPEPEAGQPPIAVGALRLSDRPDEPDDFAAMQPGDAVLVMRHLDIQCYTYQPEMYREPDDVRELERSLREAIAKLQDAVRAAEINGMSAPYARAALLAADVAVAGRPRLAWHFSPAAKRRNLTGALREVAWHRERLEGLLSSRRHLDDEDDSNLPQPGVVPPHPEYGKLAIAGRRFVDAAGAPVLVCAMSYHNEGALLEFFAPERHKVEIYAVGGGSRYDIERSPVYEAFRADPAAARVGWQGWCGHLIKDQWAMGGRKENVVICLENERILQAIDAYNREHADEWRHLPHLMYAILGYELSYMCYCEESLRRFRGWLAERHATVERLNEAWGTAYGSFDEAVPPRTEGSTAARDANRAAWYDWADWNMRRFTDHLLRTKRSVRELHLNVPLCAGGTSSMLSPLLGTTGIDEERIINEVDDVILHEGNDLLSIDLFHALSDRPKPMVDPEQGGDCSLWLLNYLHGKSAISKFWWPKQPSRQFPGSTLGSPVHGNEPIGKVAEHLYTALDVRRLSREMTAFWDVPKEAAILYSRTSMIQLPPAWMEAETTPYLRSLRRCYETARCLDAGLTFISERQLIEGKADKFKLLIVPSASHLPEGAFAALDGYVRGGGRVCVIAESLLRDEYDRAADYLDRWGIHVRGGVSADPIAFGDQVQRYDQNMERAVRFGRGVEKSATAAIPGAASFALRTAGAFQQVEAPGARIAAADEEGWPLLLARPHGQGEIWYASGMPDEASLTGLLDALFDESGIDRPLRVTDPQGNRLAGVEARLVRRKHDDLVYIANTGEAAVHYVIRTDRRIDGVRELRSLVYMDRAEGIAEAGATLLLSLREDPFR